MPFNASILVLVLEHVIAIRTRGEKERGDLGTSVEVIAPKLRIDKGQPADVRAKNSKKGIFRFRFHEERRGFRNGPDFVMNLGVRKNSTFA